MSRWPTGSYWHQHEAHETVGSAGHAGDWASVVQTAGDTLPADDILPAEQWAAEMM